MSKTKGGDKMPELSPEAREMFERERKRCSPSITDEQLIELIEVMLGEIEP